jgi:chloramphenicol-sensitive protein RarD
VKKGIWLAIGAYVTWGLFPFYWTLLHNVPALQLLGHRIIWSFVLLFSIVLLSSGWRAFRTHALTSSQLRIYAMAAVLIAINWLTYVWAVGAGFILETSLGYFINPLFSVLLGVVFLRERLRPLQWVPILLATAGVLYLTFASKSLPWIALTLAVSFGLYGLVKKKATLGSLHGLTLETGILFLPAVAYLTFSELRGQGAFLHSSSTTNLMLIGAGLVTTMPLFLFASATRRIPLSLLGLLQYINPSLQFLLGALVYHEPFDLSRLIGFATVWGALILFALEGVFANRRKPALAEAT